MAFQLMVGSITCLLTVIWGEPFIEVIRRLRGGKNIRERGDDSVVNRHLEKQGTPTFGGLLFIAPAVVTTLMINAVNVLRGRPEGRSILIPLIALILYGALGALDDLEGVRGARDKGEGLSELAKLGIQIVFALGIALALYFPLGIRFVSIPGLIEPIDLGLFFIPIAVFIILATSNGANFTDGLDGLAGNSAMIAFGAYGVIAFLQGQTWLSAFCFIMVGCLLGFLWFNAKPAQIFMGDTGSQAIGASLAIVALMSTEWLLLPIIGSIFVAETLSVIIQRTGFRYGVWRYGDREKGRVFLMAPIHHHFEVLGWHESQIVYRFFFIAFLSGLLGIALSLM